ncbi:cytochrome P450 [Rickenella mellea]|uniref:Cytochrome P450 n=1 Tax=Rickenella mellea TaxID=50990 RepID=A0A4Y7PXQ8_9AGAM|nr:cytochrome P450 [Rickenella mellea]
MLSLASCFIFVLVGFVIQFVISLVRQDDIGDAPGPAKKNASWVWGHELEVFRGQAVEVYSKWMSDYGSLFKIRAALFHRDIIVLGDHAAVQQILADTLTYMKTPSFRPIIANIIGKGLLWAEGEEHGYQRRLLSPAFTPESVMEMANDMSECAEMFEDTLTNLVLMNGGSVTLNIVPYTSHCTLDIIGRVGFGHDFRNGKSTEAQEITASWNNLVNIGMTFAGFLAPIVLRAFPLIMSIPLKSIQAQGEVREITRKLAQKLIEDGSHSEKRKNILSILLTTKSDSGGLSKSQIIDNISTFTMSGHETTAGTLNFTLLELARNPQAQERLREEVRQYGGAISYDQVSKMEYLDAVMKEGLRLHPAFPLAERVAMKDDVLTLSKPIKTKGGQILTSFRVKKGQVFHIPYMAMQTNPNVWGENAAVFKPERWLTPCALPPRNELPRGWSNLVAFSDGPRTCIGYRLALFEFKIILVTIIRTLEFRETDYKVTQKISPTLQPVVDGRGGVLPLHISIAPQA